MELISKAQVNVQDIPWLRGGHVTFKAIGVTIDATEVQAGPDGKKIVPSGTIIAKKTNGKYAPVRIVGGQPTPTADPCILFDVADVTAGDGVFAAIDHAEVIEARMPQASSGVVPDELKQMLPHVIWG